eukprot:5798190-Pyramimonas_sp.AAC.2
MRSGGRSSQGLAPRAREVQVMRGHECAAPLVTTRLHEAPAPIFHHAVIVQVPQRRRLQGALAHARSHAEAVAEGAAMLDVRAHAL